MSKPEWCLFEGNDVIKNCMKHGTITVPDEACKLCPEFLPLMKERYPKMRKIIDGFRFQIRHYESTAHVDQMTEDQELASSEEFRKGAEYGRSGTLQKIATWMEDILK